MRGRKVIPKIDVSQTDVETFEVIVRASTTTTHTVNLTQDYHQKLTGGKILPETLIEKSFEFLLERERNEMILSGFDLPTISHYFPDYEKIIVKHLRGK